MSFASDVKEEIGKQTDRGRHCQIAQFTIIFALTEIGLTGAVIKNTILLSVFAP